jgi:hypothetical protein
MKYLFLSIITFTFFSCGESTAEKTTTENKNTYDTTILINAIIDYYRQEFKKTKSDEPQAQFNIDTSEDGIELKTILDTTFATVPLNIIPFSTKFIKGDLNGDNVDDVVIPVYSTGGGSAVWQEIFVFISKDDTIELYKMYSSFDLAHCQEAGSHGGQFYPEKISNAILTGESYCYKEGDPHCCPSLKYTTEYKFDKGLIFFKQTIKD